MKKSTKYTKRLNRALRKRKVRTKLNRGDGRKHIDITISCAKLNVEVDGKQHIYDSGQLRMDIRRDNGSERRGYDTIRVPNQLVKENADKVASSISKVVASRKRKFKK